MEKFLNQEHTAEDIENLVSIFKSKVAEGGGSFSEKISMNKKGVLEVMDSDGLKSLFAHMASGGVEDVYKLAASVQELSPDINFSFERDPEGQWIKYTVRTVETIGPEVGDKVMWESQDSPMWEEPREIIRIDSHDGKQFAFFEGSATGVPVEQLKF